MPPAPSGDTISYGPRRIPGGRGISSGAPVILWRIRHIRLGTVVSLALLGARPALAADAPTFTKDVAPILYSHCAECHRPTMYAPMSLLTYDEARPYARSIKQRVVARAMPPWGADAPHGV